VTCGSRLPHRRRGSPRATNHASPGVDLGIHDPDRIADSQDAAVCFVRFAYVFWAAAYSLAGSLERRTACTLRGPNAGERPQPRARRLLGGIADPTCARTRPSRSTSRCQSLPRWGSDTCSDGQDRASWRRSPVGQDRPLRRANPGLRLARGRIQLAVAEELLARLDDGGAGKDREG
jgi:hypothetical protein